MRNGIFVKRGQYRIRANIYIYIQQINCNCIADPGFPYGMFRRIAIGYYMLYV